MATINDPLGNGSNPDLNGTSGDDTINAQGGNDVVDAGDGNDIVNGGSGDDTLNGDSGVDTLNGGAGADTLNGGDGIDALNGGNDDDTLNGGNDDDTLNGDSGADILNGGAGADTLNGGANDDTLSGGAGNDSLIGDSGNDILAGGADNDILNGGANDDTLSGDAGNDSLIGDSGNDVLAGGADDDTLDGGEGADSLSGDAGDDVLMGGTGNDALAGGEGSDSLSGGNGDDTLLGGAGDDVLTAGNGNDNLTGGTGDDILSVGEEANKVDTDTLNYSFTLETTSGSAPQSYADYLDSLALTAANLTQNQFSTTYSAWLNYLVFGDGGDWQGLVDKFGWEGEVTVGLNQNDFDGTQPHISVDGVAQDLDDLFGEAEHFTWTKGKAIQTRTFWDLEESYDWGGGTTVSSTDGNDTVTDFNAAEDVLNFTIDVADDPASLTDAQKAALTEAFQDQFAITTGEYGGTAGTDTRLVLNDGDADASNDMSITLLGYAGGDDIWDHVNFNFS